MPFSTLIFLTSGKYQRNSELFPLALTKIAPNFYSLSNLRHQRLYRVKCCLLPFTNTTKDWNPQICEEHISSFLFSPGMSIYSPQNLYVFDPNFTKYQMVEFGRSNFIDLSNSTGLKEINLLICLIETEFAY